MVGFWELGFGIWELEFGSCLTSLNLVSSQTVKHFINRNLGVEAIWELDIENWSNWLGTILWEWELGVGSWDLGTGIWVRKFGWLAGSKIFGSWELGVGSWELGFLKLGVRKLMSSGRPGTAPKKNAAAVDLTAPVPYNS